jgi:threonine dehydrogenase-like Zn-dependent dehydrogenase
VAVDAVGGARVLDAALTLVRPRGTVVSVGAHFDPSFALPVNRAFAEELTVTFAIGDAMRLRDRLLPLVAAGVIDPTVVVTERVKLTEVPDAYERFARHEAVKILIDM